MKKLKNHCLEIIFQDWGQQKICLSNIKRRRVKISVTVARRKSLITIFFPGNTGEYPEYLGENNFQYVLKKFDFWKFWGYWDYLRRIVKYRGFSRKKRWQWYRYAAFSLKFPTVNDLLSGCQGFFPRKSLGNFMEFSEVQRIFPKYSW